MRGALILFLVAVTSVAAPRADGEPANDKDPKAAKGEDPAATPARPASGSPSPEAGKALVILDRIVAGPDTAARKAAIAELTAVAPRAIDAIGSWLARAHSADEPQRRAVLAEIEASVPDKSGKFSQPPRQTGKQQKADDDLDWMTELLAIDASLPGAGEVIADVAAIRALAGTAEIHAAQVIFETAFGPETMIYRDECGRYLRKMEPSSIPALTRQSMAKNYDRRRYATFQLERMDRQEPGKALDAALGDEALTIAILDVFRATHHREAVHAVWRRVNAHSPRVRAAARAAWMDYITGPPPPPAPKAKLNLPGGKKTKKPKPLWLTYRELADHELRKAANELLHESYEIVDPSIDDSEDERKPDPIDLEDVTRRLFAYYDAERAKQEAAQWAEAKAKADAGDLASATQLADRMLATSPERSDRAELAKLYLAWGKQLEGNARWADAAAAYSKAHGLDPKAASATDALAAHHYTLGKALEADGKDGGPDFRRALALKPSHEPARTAASEVESGGRPFWMLYAAAGAAAVAMLLFAAGMMRRRA